MNTYRRIALLIGLLAILLAPQMTVERSVAQDGEGWIPYTEDMLGGGTVREDAGP